MVQLVTFKSIDAGVMEVDKAQPQLQNQREVKKEVVAQKKNGCRELNYGWTPFLLYFFCVTLRLGCSALKSLVQRIKEKKVE